MLSYIWPICLVVASNIVYHICAKYTPAGIHPLASLTVTYLMGAGVSALLYFLLAKNANLLKEYTHLNWAPFILGIVIVGLEVGFIYAYKAGWQVSSASIVQAAFLSIALVFVGFLLFHEPVSIKKIAGMAICLVGLYFINQ